MFACSIKRNQSFTIEAKHPYIHLYPNAHFAFAYRGTYEFPFFADWILGEMSSGFNPWVGDFSR